MPTAAKNRRGYSHSRLPAPLAAPAIIPAASIIRNGNKKAAVGLCVAAAKRFAALLSRRKPRNTLDDEAKTHTYSAKGDPAGLGVKAA